MRVWLQDPEVPVGNVLALQVWRRGRNADVGIRGVAALSSSRRSSSGSRSGRRSSWRLLGGGLSRAHGSSRRGRREQREGREQRRAAQPRRGSPLLLWTSSFRNLNGWDALKLCEARKNCGVPSYATDSPAARTSNPLAGPFTNNIVKAGL